MNKKRMRTALVAVVLMCALPMLAWEGTVSVETASGPTVETALDCSAAEAPRQSVRLEQLLALDLGDRVALYWTVAAQTEDLSFEVQRSANGRRFEAIGWVTGAMENAAAAREWTEYSFEDHNPFEERNYYRLRISDPQGEARWSAVVQTMSDGPGHFDARLALDLSGARAELIIYANHRDRLYAELMDARGRRQLAFDLYAEAGRNAFDLNLSSLSDGVYILRLIGLGSQRSYRVVRRQHSAGVFPDALGVVGP